MSVHGENKIDRISSFEEEYLLFGLGRLFCLIGFVRPDGERAASQQDGGKGAGKQGFESVIHEASVQEFLFWGRRRYPAGLYLKRRWGSEKSFARRGKETSNPQIAAVIAHDHFLFLL